MKNHTSLGTLLSLSFGLSVLFSCSSKPSKNDPEKKSEPSANEPIASSNTEVYQAGRQNLKPMDISGDGFPRIKKYFRDGNEQGPLERMEVDFNADGRIDMVQTMDPTGSWVAEEKVDLDGNGNMDVIQRYVRDKSRLEPRLHSQEFDARYTGQSTLWKFFDENGTLIRREIDRQGLGRPDLWEYFEKNRLVRTDQDLNGDGQPDSLPKIRKLVDPKTPDPTKSAP